MGNSKLVYKNGEGCGLEGGIGEGLQLGEFIGRVDIRLRAEYLQEVRLVELQEE